MTPCPLGSAMLTGNNWVMTGPGESAAFRFDSGDISEKFGIQGLISFSGYSTGVMFAKKKIDARMILGQPVLILKFSPASSDCSSHFV